MNNFTKNNELNKALKLTLNITDPNITVFSLSKELINGVEANVYNASLTFNKEFCPKCGAL
ncbi:hypothetical protein OKW22_001023, partial [Bacilli bacterium PM5-3]|nr:hypothetical protein [Bacilli bacterium PM5-3]